jgi:predicted nucleic acid-binding protein
MSLYDEFYLGLVVTSFVIFGAVLAVVTWIEREWAVGRDATKPHSEGEKPEYLKAA